MQLFCYNSAFEPQSWGKACLLVKMLRRSQSFIHFVNFCPHRWAWIRFGWAIAIVLVLSTLQGLPVQSTPASQFVVSSSLVEIQTFNVALSHQYPDISLFTYSGLVKQNGMTAAIEPDLAESWQIASTGRRVVFTLRRGLKWSDGQPLTAEDVVFTYRDIYFNPKIPTDVRDGFRIGDRGALPTVRQLDNLRVEFTLPESFAPFLRSTNVAILPAHALRKSVVTVDRSGTPKFLSTWDTHTPPNQVIVNGPYQIDRYDLNRQVVFRRNPYYWRKDAAGKPLPYLDRILWRLLPNVEEQVAQFRAGQLDMLSFTPDHAALLKPLQPTDKFTIQNGGVQSGSTFLTFNLNRALGTDNAPLVDPIKSGWFNTLAFRQAVAHAIDRPALVREVFQGMAQPQNSPVSVYSPYYRSPEQGLPTYDYAPDRAKTLLQQAGFGYSPQGQLLDAAGNRVQFTLLTNASSDARVQMATHIAQDLQKIGIQVKVEALAFNELVDRVLNRRDWECQLMGLTGSPEPNDDSTVWRIQGFLHVFNLAAQPGEAPLRHWQATNWERKIDRLMLQGAKELDETKRQAIYHAFQALVQEQVPVIYLVQPDALVAVHDRVTGVRFSGLDLRGALWNLDELNVKAMP